MLPNARIIDLPEGTPSSGDYGVFYSVFDGITKKFTIDTSTTVQDYEWNAATTYALNNVVIYEGKWWKSLINNNLGNIPAENANWTEVSPSPIGLVPWQAGVYIENDVFVISDIAGISQLFQLNPGEPRPFISNNFEAEYADGSWILVGDRSHTVIEKTAHGFTLGDWLTITNNWNLCGSSDVGYAQVIHVVNANFVIVQLKGQLITGLSGLTPFITYYHDAGGAVTTIPNDNVAFVAISSTVGIVSGAGSSAKALSWKNPCRVATTANITLSGEQTIDGLNVVAGDRVLVKDQTIATQNGIYVCAVGAWSRSSDADAASDLEGAAVVVQQGTSNADTTWVQTTDAITLGVSNIVWSQLGMSVPDASETVKGKIEIATQAETNTGTDDLKAITPKKLNDRIASASLTGITKLYADVDEANTDGAVDQATSQLIYQTIFISD